MEILDSNQIKVEPPKKPKKMTATRFATVLGLNAWNTPFSSWCEMTRTYEKPFEDTVYTKAGKIIEPKICDYLRERYFLDIKSPTDVYGENYFKKTWGDFFPDVNALGGMWDFLGDDFVVEVKTTKRAEDWIDDKGNPEPPIYYKLQACLYAYLLGFDNVIMTCSFLQEDDYLHPENFEPTIHNTITYEFKLSEEIPDFEEKYVKPALQFWDDYVLTGISPAFDEKKDADILKALRTSEVNPTDSKIKKLLTESDRLRTSINNAENKLADKKERLKEIDDTLKKYMIRQFSDTDKTVELNSKKFNFTVTKSVRNTLDSKALKKDMPDVFDKYLTSNEIYTLKTKNIE